jgi:hypothetical protein
MLKQLRPKDYPAVRQQYLTEAKAIVARTLRAYPAFIDAVMEEKPNARKPHRFAYRWMLKLAVLGLYYHYPVCCIELFISDFFELHKKGLRTIAARQFDCEYIPCDECLAELGRLSEAIGA